MKILVASFTYPPNVDGVAEAAKTMVANFHQGGHEVSIATFLTNKPSGAPAQDDTSVHRFQITGAPALMVGFQGEITAYQNFIISLNPEVIVFHCWDTWPLEIALPLLPRLRAKSVLLSHGHSCHLLDPSILPRGFSKWLRWLPHVIALPWKLRQFDKVVFLSKKTDLNRFFDAWVARWTGCRNTTVIPNTINTEGWETIPSSFRQDEALGDGVFFLCVANYFTGKNQEMALQAYVQAHIPDSTLVFIGSSLGEYGRRVQSLWDQMRSRFPSLEVRFFEHLSRQQVISATRSCDVAVLASKTEAQPLTILEAMACGKPFICTDVGCVSEMRGGVVVANQTEMATQMKRLAEDENERLRLGTQAQREFDASYSPEVTGRAWLELIESLTSTRA